MLSRGAKILSMVTMNQPKAKDPGDNIIRSESINTVEKEYNGDCTLKHGPACLQEQSRNDQVSLPGPSHYVTIQEKGKGESSPKQEINNPIEVFRTAGSDDSFSDFSPSESEYYPSNTSSDSEEANISNDSSDPEVSHTRNQLVGMEEHPEETNKPRRKRRNPDIWPRNIRKKNRLLGKEYVSTRGVMRPAIQMMPPCKETCRLKCSVIPEAERLKIFKAYYELGDYSRQRDFIHANTEKKVKKTKTTEHESRRNFSINYYLPIDGSKKKICKVMFLNTLGIRKGVVDIAMKKRSKENIAASDGRGKGKSGTLDPAIVLDVMRHIKSFPCFPSHYCRADIARKYLDSLLNLATMYRMYVQWCQENGRTTAKLSTYRNCFKDNFNLGFHRPKKDQCRICVAFNSEDNPTEEMKTDYHAHQKLKDNAREAKRLDKEAALNNNNIISCNFDLQQVLLCPSDPTNNALFYKRRLATYNFTIYNVVTKQDDCFMWHEGQGGRGSSEIATHLFRYFQSLPSSIEEVRCFSDRCGGQNLNKFVVAMCMHAVQTIANIKSIHLKFLTPDHSEMECDSMHSAIGSEFKRVGKALWPGDWKTIARSARKKGDKPYNVYEIQGNDFFDWKTFAKTQLTMRKKDTNNKPVPFQKLCWFRFKKENVYEYECNKTFDVDGFIRVDCKKKALRRQTTSLIPCYPRGHSITELKYKDLMSLFSMTPPALSRDYYDFYFNLQHGITNEDSDEEDD